MPFFRLIARILTFRDKKKERKKRRLLTKVPSRMYNVMSKVELVSECKHWGLLVGGKKEVLVKRLEDHTRGLRTLPFKILVSTPTKRPRNQSNEEVQEVQASTPSKKKKPGPVPKDEDSQIMKDEGARKISKIVRNEDCRKEAKSEENDAEDLEISTEAAPSIRGHLLQEDNTRVVKDLQGRAIAGSNSFPHKGEPNFLKTTANNTEQQNNRITNDISVSSQKSIFEHNSRISPNNTSSNHHTPGETKELAAHSEQGVT